MKNTVSLFDLVQKEYDDLDKMQDVEGLQDSEWLSIIKRKRILLDIMKQLDEYSTEENTQC